MLVYLCCNTTVAHLNMQFSALETNLKPKMLLTVNVIIRPVNDTREVKIMALCQKFCTQVYWKVGNVFDRIVLVLFLTTRRESPNLSVVFMYALSS